MQTGPRVFARARQAPRQAHGDRSAFQPDRGALHWGLLLLVLGTGAWLRWHNLGAQPLWGDEALSLIIAHFDTTSLFLRSVDPTPGLYYLVQKIAMSFGTDPLTTRLPSFLFGVATIPAAYWLGRTLRGPAGGLFTALLVAVMPEWIFYSQEARAYALLLLMVTLSLGFLASALSSDRPDGRRLIASGAFAVLALYTHVTAWFLVAPLALWTLLRVHRQFPLRKLLVWVGLGIVLVVPEVRRAVAHSQAGQYDWLAQMHPRDVVRMIARLVTPMPIMVEDRSAGGVIVMSARTELLATLATLASVAVLALLLLLRIRAKDRAAPVEVMIVTSLVILMPLGLYLVGFYKPLLVPRSILPFQLGIALVLAPLAARATGRWLVALYAALLCVEGWIYHRHFQRDAWDRIAAIVEEADPEDGVLVCPDWQAASFVYAQLELRRGQSNRPMTTITGGRIIDLRSGATTAEALPRAYFEKVWKPLVDGDGPGPARAAEEFDPGRLGDLVVVERCDRAIGDQLEAWFPEDRRDYLARRSPSLSGYAVYRLDRQ